MPDWSLIELAPHSDGVWVLTLRDGKRHNAISTAMRDELVACAAQIAADDTVRVLVVHGAGRSFCSGADLNEILAGPGRPVGDYRDSVSHVYEAFLGIRSLAIPTIAAVHGHAIGAGLNLALCCDIRLAGPTARFGATFTRLGLHPGGGCSYFLTAALGAQRALAILLRGETIRAGEAVRLGLVLELHDDPLAAALAMAAAIAALPPGLARDIKATVRLAETGGFAAALAHETWAQAATAAQPQIWETLRGRRETT